METSSVLIEIKGCKKLIVCFGGRALKQGGVIPFEFLNYLIKTYKEECDFIFIIDKYFRWYHKGVEGVTSTIEETALYLNKIIENGKYDKVLFMGTSAGGYAAILFGSICNNIDSVIAFIPQTILKEPEATPTKCLPKDQTYTDLKTIINNKTNYTLYGNHKEDENPNHHISHCLNLAHFENVHIIKPNHFLGLKKLRDDGILKILIDDAFKGVNTILLDCIN